MRKKEKEWQGTAHQVRSLSQRKQRATRSRPAQPSDAPTRSGDDISVAYDVQQAAARSGGHLFKEQAEPDARI